MKSTSDSKSKSWVKSDAPINPDKEFSKQVFDDALNRRQQKTKPKH